MDVAVAAVAAETGLKESYRDIARQYRHDDEIEVTTEHHRRVADRLRELTAEFGRPINVLEAGCGTGRNFHCLRNVDLLVGIDLSPEMLEAARQPVRAQEVTARKIHLLSANIHRAHFDAGMFDFIFSLGMFGNGCPISVEILNRFYAWLAPGGRLFFNAIDVSGLPAADRFRRRVRHLVYPWLPARWQNRLDARAERHPFFPITHPQLDTMLRESRFHHFEIARHPCASPLWHGTHLECLASK